MKVTKLTISAEYDSGYKRTVTMPDPKFIQDIGLRNGQLEWNSHRRASSEPQIQMSGGVLYAFVLAYAPDPSTCTFEDAWPPNSDAEEL